MPMEGRHLSIGFLLDLKEKEKQTLRFGSWPLKCRLLHKKWRRFVRIKAFEVEGTQEKEKRKKMKKVIIIVI